MPQRTNEGGRGRGREIEPSYKALATLQGILKHKKSKKQELLSNYYEKTPLIVLNDPRPQIAVQQEP